MRKVLTFRAASIGDTLMAKYFLENAHAQFPDAMLGIVVASRGSMIRDLLKSSPYITIVETNRRDSKGLYKLWKQFRGADLAVTQYAGKHGGQFGLSSKIAARVLAKSGGLIGFTDISPINKYIYSHLLPVRSDMPVAEHEREALRAAGLTVSIPYPRLHIVPDAKVPSSFGVTANTYIVAHFFAGNAGRSISPDKARELLQLLTKHLPQDTQILVSGGAMDREIALSLTENLPNVRVIAGEASLQDMLQLIYFAKGVVSVDTGIAHISAQLEKPLVVMRTCLGPNWWYTEQYGPSARIVQFSREDLCTPHIKKDYPECINAISMLEVAQKFVEMI